MTAGPVSRRNLLRTAGVTAGTLLAAGLPGSRAAAGTTDLYLPRRPPGRS